MLLIGKEAQKIIGIVELKKVLVLYVLLDMRRKRCAQPLHWLATVPFIDKDINK